MSPDDKVKTLNALRAYKDELLKETNNNLKSMKDQRNATKDNATNSTTFNTMCNASYIFYGNID